MSNIDAERRNLMNPDAMNEGRSIVALPLVLCGVLSLCFALVFAAPVLPQPAHEALNFAAGFEKLPEMLNCKSGN